MTRVGFASLATVAASLAVACADATSSSAPTSPDSDRSVTKSGLARDTNPNLTQEEKQAYEEGSLALTTDLLAQLRKEGSASKNLAYSPASIALALSMPYAGARGETASEMAKAMHWTLPQDRMAKVYNYASLQLAERMKEAQAAAAARSSAGADRLAGENGIRPATASPLANGSNADDIRIHSVNALWADQTLTIESPFLDSMAVNYGAGVTRADFIGKPDSERKAINTWVSRETRDKINDLLPENSIRLDTRLVLVNAMHLKMPWDEPMQKQGAPLTFTQGDGAAKQVPSVGQLESLGYFENSDVQAVRVPLLGGSVAALFVLPKRDLDSFESSVTPAALEAIRAGLASKRVNLTLPVFNFTSDSISLKNILKSLGMVRAFDEADFSAISASTKLSIGDVFHKAMVGLDENGVEAAAATAVVMLKNSASGDQEQPKVFTANKPFMFMIEDLPTKTVLFAGHVHTP